MTMQNYSTAPKRQFLWDNSPLRFKWNKLDDEARSIVDEVLNSWLELLSQKHKEEGYHDFLRENAGFVLAYCAEVNLLNSKLRLGADFITDFVVGRDQHSNGLWYELIEIETPHDAPFTQKGNPSARLTMAIQQVQNWRRWIIDNRREIAKLLPNYGFRTSRKDPNFNFKIIIGTRENSEKWLDRRNDLANQIGIQIRSFEYFTDSIQTRFFLNSCNFASTEEGYLSSLERNMLANPFCVAYSDKTWRKIISEPRYIDHFFCNNAKVLLDNRSYNKLFNDFNNMFG
jgi:Domain of unknown function (DUF4263)